MTTEKQINKVLAESGYGNLMYCRKENEEYKIYSKETARPIFNLTKNPEHLIESFLDIWVHMQDWVCEDLKHMQD